MLERDLGGKWLIWRHGNTLLRLGGARRFAAWKAVQAEPVHARRLPDGMIEDWFRGRPRPVLYVLEISAYPYSRLARQAADDALLVYLTRGVVPEVISIVLRPRGKKPAPRELAVASEEARREGVREAERKTTESNLLTVLASRFGAEAEAAQAEVKALNDDRLKEVFGLAATCPDLASFREQIAPRRRKRRS